MNLYEASNQWATRPSDERFFTIDEMLLACKSYSDRACQATIATSQLKVGSEGEEVQLIGSDGGTAKLSYWAFSQLAARARAPATYLRTLPANLAAECLNDGFRKSLDRVGNLELMFHRTEDEH